MWRRIYINKFNGRINYLDRAEYQSEEKTAEIKGMYGFTVLVDLPDLVVVTDTQGQLHVMWKVN